MDVAIVSVGDELLAGETVNTNAAWLARRLLERGVRVERVTVVPDRVADLADVVGDHHEDYDAVIVTGGLGPTHDDVTVDGVAAAFEREVVEHEAVLEWLAAERDYARADLADGTADLPAGATPLHNPEGVAPGFVLKRCYVLPGVPAEMEAMFPSIADDFAGDARHVTVVESTEPESALLDRIETIRNQFDVTVGSYPGETVSLRLESDDPEAVAAAATWAREHVDTPEE